MASLGVAIVREYERGVVFRVGKIRSVRNPGLRFMIPLVDRMQKVTLRTVTKPIQSHQIITKDNVSIGVAAVAYLPASLPAQVTLDRTADAGAGEEAGAEAADTDDRAQAPNR